jgi:hypothetical protein
MYSTLILLLIFSSPQEFRCCCHLSPAPPIPLSIKICKIINPKSTPLLLLLLTWTPKPRWQGNNVSDNIILVPLGLGENSSCHDYVDVDKNRSVQTPASTHHVGYTAAPTSGSPSVATPIGQTCFPSSPVATALPTSRQPLGSNELMDELPSSAPSSTPSDEGIYTSPPGLFRHPVLHLHRASPLP